AAFLNAERCEILKDVSSIYSADPKLISHAKKITELNYDHLLEMTFWGAKVLHYRSVELAKVKDVKLYVGPAHNYENNSASKSEGTLIHGEFMFESSRPLAVNSHSKVLEISIAAQQFSDALDIFNNFTLKHNIGTPQVLCGFIKDSKIHLYITAPNEILIAIENVDYKQLPFIKIENANLCSTSLTCTGSSLNETLKHVTSELQKNNIHVHYFTQSAMSLNYIIDQNQKDNALKALHHIIEMSV
ncbi:MAG: aspartate kinase, partial [Pseudobdellovibrio sp.]